MIFCKSMHQKVKLWTLIKETFARLFKSIWTSDEMFIWKWADLLDLTYEMSVKYQRGTLFLPASFLAFRHNRFLRFMPDLVVTSSLVRGFYILMQLSDGAQAGNNTNTKRWRCYRSMMMNAILSPSKAANEQSAADRTQIGHGIRDGALQGADVSEAWKLASESAVNSSPAALLLHVCPLQPERLHSFLWSFTNWVWINPLHIFCSFKHCAPSQWDQHHHIFVSLLFLWVDDLSSGNAAHGINAGF